MQGDKTSNLFVTMLVVRVGYVLVTIPKNNQIDVVDTIPTNDANKKPINLVVIYNRKIHSIYKKTYGENW